MKKILLRFTIFSILFLGIIAVSKGQSYFYNTTLGTTPVRIVALETNVDLTNSYLYQKQWATILGTASGEIQFSFGDSLFSTKRSITFGADKSILISSLWIPGMAVPMIWIKSTSGTINVDLQTRVF